VRQTYGDYGEVRNSLFESAKDANILLLDEGSYEFRLRNGALLKIYTSPYSHRLVLTGRVVVIGGFNIIQTRVISLIIHKTSTW
jgi:hypothetical protein